MLPREASTPLSVFLAGLRPSTQLSQYHQQSQLKSTSGHIYLSSPLTLSCMTWQIVIENSTFAKMATQTITDIEQDDTSTSKSGDIVQHQENEKSLTESPVESVNPSAEHVTAKTWLVIFVSFLLSDKRKHKVLTMQNSGPLLDFRSQFLACSNNSRYGEQTFCKVRRRNICILDEYVTETQKLPISQN
jgi:hypothetical protein